MSRTLSVTELARQLSEYVNRVAYGGESFVLVRGHKQVAELRPLPRGQRLAELPALLAGLPHLAADDVTSFEADLDAARRTLATSEDRDPWES